MAFNFGGGGFGFGAPPAPAPAAPAFGAAGGFGGFGGFGAPAAAAAPAAPAFGGFGAAAPAAGGFGAAAAPGDVDIQVPLAPGTDSISSLAWSPNSQFLAASSWDNKVTVWSVNKGPTGAPASATPAQQRDFAAPALDCKWAPDSTNVFVVGCNNKVKMWNVQANTETELGSHDAPIKSVHWCPTANVLVTGSWDKTVRYWDPRTAGKEVAKVQMPERVHAMDVQGQAMVAATADKKIHIFNLANPTVPMRSIESPLKFQTRSLRIFQDSQFFAVASIEGRCAIRCIDEGMDKETEYVNGASKQKYSFTFKCHRDVPDPAGREMRFIYSLNAMDTHPVKEFHGVFCTAGSDGIMNFWDRGKRQRLREFKNFCPPQYPAGKLPVTAVRFNDGGDMFAYAGSYDWGKGADGYDPKVHAPQVWVHQVNADKDLRPKK